MAKTPTGKNTSGRGQRDLKVKVKTGKAEIFRALKI